MSLYIVNCTERLFIIPIVDEKKKSLGDRYPIGPGAYEISEEQAKLIMRVGQPFLRSRDLVITRDRATAAHIQTINEADIAGAMTPEEKQRASEPWFHGPLKSQSELASERRETETAVPRARAQRELYGIEDSLILSPDQLGGGKRRAS